MVTVLPRASRAGVQVAILSHVSSVPAISWSSSLARGRERYRGVYPFLGLLPPNGVSATVSLVHRKSETRPARARNTSLISLSFLFFSFFPSFCRNNINIFLQYMSLYMLPHCSRIYPIKSANIETEEPCIK